MLWCLLGMFVGIVIGGFLGWVFHAVYVYGSRDESDLDRVMCEVGIHDWNSVGWYDCGSRFGKQCNWCHKFVKYDPQSGKVLREDRE